jgi:uncharacterized protein
MIKLLVIALALAATLIVAITLLQGRMVFPAYAVPPAGPLPSGAEPLAVETPDGHRLHGVYLPPIVANEPETPRTLVLGFGGNVWNAQDVAAELHRLFPHMHVVVFHYRGYRPSTGVSSARALLGDAPLVHDAAIALVRPARTIAVGFSIGSGVAASLVRQRHLDGLILVTPFDSLKALAAELFPWLPVGLLFKHEMDAAGCLEGSRVPVAIIAAGRDEVIPRSRTNALRARVPRLVFDRTIEGASHNDLYVRAEFERAMRDGLAAVTRRERQKT